MVLVLLEPTQESLQPCRSTTTISRVSVRLCAQYPPFDAPTNACSTTASLEQQASRPFQTDPGEQNRTDFPLASDQTWSCVGLGWSDWRNCIGNGARSIVSGGLIGLEAPAAAGGSEKTSEPGFWCGSRRPIEGLVGTHPSPISREPSFHRPSLRAAVWPGSTRTPSRLSLAWLGFSGRLCKAMGTRKKI